MQTGSKAGKSTVSALQRHRSDLETAYHVKHPLRLRDFLAGADASGAAGAEPEAGASSILIGTVDGFGNEKGESGENRTGGAGDSDLLW